MHRWSPVVILIGLGLTVMVAVYPALAQGYPYVHSIGSNLLWAFQYGQQFCSGQFYPRWLEQSFGSLGSPTFAFYPPLSMVGALPFACWGWPVTWQVIGSGGLALLVLAAGYWWTAQRLFPAQRWLWPLMAVMGSLFPYGLICLHIRGALGEVWAMAWVPWIVGAVIQGSPLGMAVGVSLVALSHVPTVLNGIGLWLLVVLVQTLLKSRQGGWVALFWLWKGLWPLALGLGLAGFFLVPAWLDQGLVNIGYLEVFKAHENFLVTRWAWTAKDAFQVQLIPSFVLVAVTVLIWGVIGLMERLSQRQIPTVVAWLAGGSLFCLWMMTDASHWLYAAISTLQRIQFAWRWLALASGGWVLLWGSLLHHGRIVFPKRPIVAWLSWGVTLLILGINYHWMWQNIIFWPDKAQQLDTFLAERPAFPQEVDMTALPWQTVDFGMLRNRQGEPGLLDVWEYTPRTLVGSPNFPPRNDPVVAWEAGSGDITDVQWRPGSRRFRVVNSSGGRLNLRMHAWAGWQVRVNDQAQAGDQVSGDGRLQVKVPAQDVTVTIDYRGTPAAQWGWRLSGLSAVIGLGLGGYETLLKGSRSAKEIR